MSDFIFPVARSAGFTFDPTRLGVLLLKANAQSDRGLKAYATLASLLAASGNVEANFTNYARKTGLTGDVVNHDTVNHRLVISLPEQTWASAGGAVNNSLVRLIVFYDQGGTDATRIPLIAYDIAATTDAADLTAEFSARGLTDIAGNSMRLGTANPGVPIVRKFPFAFDTPGLLTGDADLYVPTIGDLLLDGWVVIESAWNGTTPTLNIGRWNRDLESENGGWWRWFLSPAFKGIAANNPDEIAQFEFGMLSQIATGDHAISDLAAMFAFTTPPPTNSAYRAVPARFVTPEPVAAVVTTNGKPTTDSVGPGADPGSTQGAATLYLMTVTPV